MTVQPIDDGRVGVSTRTLRRRLSSVSGLYAFLHARGDVTTNLGGAEQLRRGGVVKALGKRVVLAG